MIKNYLIAGPVTTGVISSAVERMEGITDSGGQSLFLGRVRADIIAGKRVSAIEYSAYETMVQAEADKIIEEILSEYTDSKSVEIIHSTGLVRAGELSLLVIVSAGHRRQAIEACAKTVELVKERLPVWKKELFDDGSHVWRQNS